MSSWLWSCVLLITLQSTIYVKSSPLCIEADVPKKFCGEAMVDAITLNCRSYPSPQSKRSTGDALGVVDMCCLKECTLRILLENYCLNTKDFRPCPRTNHINQDQDIVQTPSIKQGNDIKPMQEPQKQPEADAKSAAKAHKSAEVGVSVKFFRGSKCHCKRITHNRNNHRFSQIKGRRDRKERMRPSLSKRLRYRVHRRAQHAKRHVDITSNQSDTCHKNHDKHRRRPNKPRRCRCRRRTLMTKARLSNTILQEARVGIEENDQIESLYQSMPNSVSSYANSKDFNRYPKRFGRNIDDSSDED